MKNGNYKVKVLGKLGAILGVGTLLIIPTVTVVVNTSANQISIINSQNNANNNTEQSLIDDVSMSATGDIIQENDLVYTKASDDSGYFVAAAPDAIITGHLDIPDTHLGLPVSGIKEDGFKDQVQITSVVIPDSVHYSGSGAFSGCYSLTSINLSNKTESLSQNMFSNCYALTNIVIPETVMMIEDRAFLNCYSLTNIVISDRVKVIANSAFANCFSLTSVDIGAQVSTITDDAFANCPLTSITIDPNNQTFKKVTNVGPNATVIVKETTELNENCSNIVGKLAFGNLTISNTTTSIADYAFEDCAGLTGITISDSVTLIGQRAFNNCSSLTSINFSGNLKTIKEGAFAWCSSLTSIIIPDSVTLIEQQAFMNCTSLVDVTIGSGITQIPTEMFSECSNLISMEIPNNIIGIGTAAFRSCSNLINVSFGSGLGTDPMVKPFDNASFSFCPLTSIIIDSSNPKITLAENVGDCLVIIDKTTGTKLNNDCSNIISGMAFGDLVLPSTVTSITDSIFMGSELKSITIPDSVNTIGKQAFLGSLNLSEVIIGSKIILIDEMAFDSCLSLTSITIKATFPPKLGANAFGDVRAQLKLKIYVPDKSIKFYTTNEFWYDYAPYIYAIPPQPINPLTNNNLAIIIGCSVGGVVLLAAITAGTIFGVKKYHKPKK